MQAINSTRLKLPWWTWVVPLPVFFFGTMISLQAKITTGSSLFYFPLPFALILVYWWGPRVLPAFYLNAVGCAGFWGLEKLHLWPVYGLPETVFAFLSWLFFVKLLKGNISLSNTKQVVYFLIAGVLVPLVIYKFLLETIFALAGDAPIAKYWNLMITTGFGDFISAFCVSVPVLYFITRFMARNSLANADKKLEGNISDTIRFRTQWFELLLIAILVYCINAFLGFLDYWFLNGILSLYVAMRFGFGATILMNSYVLVVTYMLPVSNHDRFAPSHFLQADMLKTQLGTTLLYVFTVITGRLVSDMRQTELSLQERNKELKQINSELDQFVYSVSHDLSAPLKSILGLVNISRSTVNENELRHQFNLIEKSVNTLQAFIYEVLDYSRSKRKEVTNERIDLKIFAAEIFNDLKYMDGFGDTELDVDGVTRQIIITDRSRLKIILQNIFSNAIRFRRKDQKSFIKISTESPNGKLILLAEDNGEGIKEEYLSKIFDMFFKGTDRSQGSGLGLYIANEAANKISARISVQSNYGSGSIFRIEFDKGVSFHLN